MHQMHQKHRSNIIIQARVKKNENELQNAQKAQNRQYRRSKGEGSSRARKANPTARFGILLSCREVSGSLSLKAGRLFFYSSWSC